MIGQIVHRQVLGQLERQRRKIYGTEREKRHNDGYEKSVNTLSKDKDKSKLTSAQIDAETKKRRSQI